MHWASFNILTLLLVTILTALVFNLYTQSVSQLEQINKLPFKWANFILVTHTRLMAIFPGLPGWASTRKSAPRSRQTTMPEPRHSVFYRPDALPATQPTPTASKHWRNLILIIIIIIIPLQCSWCCCDGQGHSECSPTSFDECRVSTKWPPMLRPRLTEPIYLGCESAENCLLPSMSLSPFAIIT